MASVNTLAAKCQLSLRRTWSWTRRHWASLRKRGWRPQAWESHVSRLKSVSASDYPWHLESQFPLSMKQDFSGIFRHIFSASLCCLRDLNSYFCLQATWCPEQCTTCSPSMPSTTATAPPCTTSRGRSTGSLRPCTPFAISCTARKWSGKIPTWSLPKSTSRWKGKTCLHFATGRSFPSGHHRLVMGGWALPPSMEAQGWGRGGMLGSGLPSSQRFTGEVQMGTMGLRRYLRPWWSIGSGIS